MHAPDNPPTHETSASPDTPVAARVTPEQLAAAARTRDYWIGRTGNADTSEAGSGKTGTSERP